jgi:tryptophanyl-tRNA synthetase
MQHENKCFFFIADYHSLTTHPVPGNLHGNVKQVLAEYLACGLDPSAATIYIQSDVPEVTELYLLLNMIAYTGELERTTTFKDKVRNQPENVNAGLLTYPVLMAADIIIHKATKVPVGKDQQPHLEITRKLARRFNNMYNAVCFPEPEAYNFGEKLVKIPGLDGSGKMGKSEGNALYLSDDEKTIRKKVMRAVTDSGPTPGQRMSEPVRNLFTIMDYVSEPAAVKHFKASYKDGTIRYGDLKKHLAEDLVSFISPLRTRIGELLADGDYLGKVAREGAEKARASASETIREVRRLIGFRHNII